NLYFATQVIELGYPVIVALNMIDVAAENGHEIDAAQLSGLLGVPVVPLVANRGKGVEELKAKIIELTEARSRQIGTPPIRFCNFPTAFEREVAALAQLLASKFPEARFEPRPEASLLLSDDRFLNSSANYYPPLVGEEVMVAGGRLEKAAIDWRSVAIEARYARIAEIQRVVTKTLFANKETFSDKLDRVLTHKVWGLLIFLVLMFAMFQSIF